MKQAARLLVVDDDESNRDMLSRRLRRSGYEVETAEGGQHALDILAAHSFDLVLLDNMMPGLSGIDVLRVLRQKYSASRLPVIMVTAQAESDNVVAALQQGANDYITKPVDLKVALARIETQLAHHAAERELLLHAETAKTIDPGTSLPNRIWLEQRVSRIRSSAGPARALLLVEPDQFDRTNDCLAPELSKTLVEEFVQRLRDLARSLTRRPAAIARCGENQFALLVSGSAALDPNALAGKLRCMFETPFVVKGQSIFLVPTIGVAVCGPGGGEGLLRDALSALRHARESGIGHCEVFNPAMRQQDLDALRLENDLRRAVEHHEFAVHYQPKINLKTGGIDGFEALLRWRRPAGRLASPAEFIGTAERTDLIVPIGKQVLDQATCDTMLLRTSFPDVAVSVNVSARQFVEPDLFEQVIDALQKSGLPPAALRIEVTESILITNPQSARDVLQRLRGLGIGLKLDDFGTGYSSLSYLHQFPFDTLKIDRSFVSRLTAAGDGLAVVQVIIKLARMLNMKVVAEGLETVEQARVLQQLGVDYGQGYYFSRPVDLPALRQLLETWDTKEVLRRIRGSKPDGRYEPAA